MEHRRRVSRTRASRARIPCKLALFAFTTFTAEGTTARWVFLRLVIFQCSVRAFLRAFFGLFSPSWDEKQPEMLKCVRKKCVSRCGWGSCNEICEGCESKKCKISVDARTRTREKGVFRFIHGSLLAFVGSCCHTSMERGERVSRRFQICLRCLAKNVGDFPKNVGDFLKNVGDFSENVGVFLWEVRSEWEGGRKCCRRRCKSVKASVGQRDEIKESFGHLEGKPYFCRE